MVSDIAVMYFTSSLVNYLVIYRRNRFIGSVLFAVLGLAGTLIEGSEYPFGLMIFFIGLISSIWEFTKIFNKRL